MNCHPRGIEHEGAEILMPTHQRAQRITAKQRELFG
jgi:hypothetical protein